MKNRGRTCRKKSWSDDNLLCLKTKLPKYDNHEMQERIDREIHDALDRRIMHDKLIDNLTLQQISDKEDIPLSTVRDHYYKQRAILFPDISRK